MAAPVPAQGSAIHPEHDAVSGAVRSWYNSSFPEIGLNGAAHWFGFRCTTGSGNTRVLLTITDPADVAAALADAQAGTADSVVIMIDDRDRAARLDPALRAFGCRHVESVTYLALTGPVVSAASGGPERLKLASVETADLGTWARLKLQCFADNEDEPTTAAIDADVAVRRMELPISQYQLGILDGEPVGVLAHYPGEDDLVFVLGTRSPYRHRGIARGMLARWVAATAGARSHLINAADGGAPAALYRRLGFTDEVYWYSRYELSLPAAA